MLYFYKHSVKSLCKMSANRADVYPSGFEYLLWDKEKPECKGKNPLMDNDHGSNQPEALTNVKIKEEHLKKDKDQVHGRQ